MVVEGQHLEMLGLAVHIEDTTMSRQDLGMDQNRSISVFIIPSDGTIISSSGNEKIGPSAQLTQVPERPSHRSQRQSHARESSLNPYDFTAEIKFKSTLAQCGEDKTSGARIDLGGSHNFFKAKASFSTTKKSKVFQLMLPRRPL